jgi:lipopolysaccharide biosynthesis regulator YciM
VAAALQAQADARLQSRTYVAMARAALRRDDQAGAMSLLGRALNVDPHDPLAAGLIGQIYVVRGQYKQAVRPLELATRAFPRLPHLHAALGKAYRELGDRARAQKALDRARALERERAEESARARASSAKLSKPGRTDRL